MKHRWQMILGIGGAVILVVLISLLVWGNTWRMMLANRDFQSGKLDQAGAVYQEMGVDQPKSPYILHNQSLVAYERAKNPAASAQYPVANQFMAKALQEAAQRKKIAAADLNKLYYQAGNAAFQAGATTEAAAKQSGGATIQRGAGNALTVAGNLYQEALQHYKKAIETDSSDQAAKYNYELTQLRLKQNRENQKQQSEGGGKQESQKEQQNSHSGNQNNNQNQPGKQNRTDKGNGSQNSGKQPRPNGPMTKEEAEALLKMAENGDQYQTPQVSGSAGSPEKDW